jgi:ParB family chromosome partitioning protein
VWVCTDPAAAGLHHYWDNPTPATTPTGATDEAAVQEAARAQRREVIANNRAWRSAETVRREWLREFLARKTPPRGAEQVIARAVLTGQTSLWRAMSEGHPHLLALLGLDAATGHRTLWRDLLDQPRDPKAAAMLTLGAVLAAWEQASGVHTWRQPDPWDRAVMTALNGWGYQPSTVEQLLLADAATEEQATDTTPA